MPTFQASWLFHSGLASFSPIVTEGINLRKIITLEDAKYRRYEIYNTNLVCWSLLRRQIRWKTCATKPRIFKAGCIRGLKLIID